MNFLPTSKKKVILWGMYTLKMFLRDQNLTFKMFLPQNDCLPLNSYVSGKVKPLVSIKINIVSSPSKTQSFNKCRVPTLYQEPCLIGNALFALPLPSSSSFSRHHFHPLLSVFSTQRWQSSLVWQKTLDLLCSLFSRWLRNLGELSKQLVDRLSEEKWEALLDHCLHGREGSWSGWATAGQYGSAHPPCLQFRFFLGQRTCNV